MGEVQIGWGPRIDEVLGFELCCWSRIVIPQLPVAIRQTIKMTMPPDYMSLQYSTSGGSDYTTRPGYPLERLSRRFEG